MDVVHIVWDISVSYLQYQDKHVQGTMHTRYHAVFRNVWTLPQFDPYRSIQFSEPYHSLTLIVPFNSIHYFIKTHIQYIYIRQYHIRSLELLK